MIPKNQLFCLLNNKLHKINFQIFFKKNHNYLTKIHKNEKKINNKIIFLNHNKIQTKILIFKITILKLSKKKMFKEIINIFKDFQFYKKNKIIKELK